jgi:carboxymethylenebutenolidase
MGRPEYVTPSIAQFMRDLEQAWEAHQQALIKHRDLAAALAPLAPEPAITHIPAMTGATGRQTVERFYAEQFLPYVPDDLKLSKISRTVDRWRLVDETTVSFTHDRELPWLLPGIAPTFRRAEVLAIAVVGFERMRIRSQRVLWDHATLAAQLNLTDRVASGPAR